MVTTESRGFIRKNIREHNVRIKVFAQRTDDTPTKAWTYAQDHTTVNPIECWGTFFFLVTGFEA